MKQKPEHFHEVKLYTLKDVQEVKRVVQNWL